MPSMPNDSNFYKYKMEKYMFKVNNLINDLQSKGINVSKELEKLNINYNELKNDLQQFGGSFHNNNNNKALTYNKYKLNKK